ncbi:MAG: amidohydrolase [Bacillota bacterium]
MDLILHNGNIITMDKRSPRVRAVAARGGKIVASGQDAAVLTLREPATTVVDLKGKTVVPGFNDSHMHLLGYALTRNMVDLRRCHGAGELARAIQGHIREHEIGQGAWVFGWGWDQTLFADREMPTRADLDIASTEHCLVALRTCGHLCAVNTATLRAAGIFEKPPAVKGGSVAVDKHGVPTGVLAEKAMDLVLGLLPSIGKDIIKALILMAAEDFLKAGLTSVQTDDLAHFKGDVSEVLNAYIELDQAGAMPLRVNAQLLLPTLEKLRAFLAMGYRTGFGSDFFKIGPLKLLTDGSLGGRTAYLAAPYSDDPGSRGIPVLNRELLEELVETAHAAGMQVAAHAIGDAAVEMALDSFARAQKSHPRDDPRFRIIHASFVRPDLLDRFKRQRLAADIQPAFVPSDSPFVEDRLGPDRARWVYCWRSFLEKGIRMGGGSDCPVESYQPLLGLHAAVTRQDLSGHPPGGWFPGQKLTVEEALAIFTLGSAYCSFEEDLKGSITPGKLADMVVLSEDITRINPDQIKDMTVEMTVMHGKLVWAADR